MRRKRPSERAMSTENGLRTGSCLLAVVLIGVALSMRAGFAEDAGSAARDDTKASDHSTAPAGDKLDTQSAPRGDNDKGIAGESGDKTPDGIDTRIAVQPRRAGAKLGGDAKAKIELPAVVNPHRRTFPAVRTSNQTLRNAVGVPVPRHDSAERHDGVHSGYSAGPYGAVLTKPIGQIDRPAAIAKPLIAPTIANRGAINGTGLVHRGSGPSRIGGPSAAVVGINGTTIRSKH
jgi:hypothetical protein